MTRYNYRFLRRKPKACGFVLGWTAQRVVCLTHFASCRDNSRLWREAAGQVYRIVALLKAVAEPGRHFAPEVGGCVRRLMHVFGDDSYWTSDGSQCARRYLAEKLQIQ